MKQQSLDASGFEKYRKKTRKELFLEQMNEILPWVELCKAIEPFYPKASALGGRPAIGLERMLRIHFLQHWFELSDPGAEEALYDSRAMRQFVGIDLGKEPVPDETTICKFRHLMERHNLGGELFQLVNVYLEENGLKLNRGTIVDATIIDAPRSTKNKERHRDPDMESTQKGNQWYFGMKTHIGVDSQTRLIHSVVVTSASVHDSQVLGDLLHGNEKRVYGDSAYIGQKAQIKANAEDAADFTHRRGRRNHPLSEKERKANRHKSKIRPRVEHLFGVIKNQFGYRKVRYKGLEKNAQAVFTKCALANLVIAKRHLLAI
ncbi:IS5 family transposase [Halioxenophilus aromaticivorans]|uniref:IS5-like element ISPsy2 family transposase n=1 Tax=Halioxenophilus aromaticivorans TaxID=1306992 RepID=A0AAV3U867_9ALTE